MLTEMRLKLNIIKQIRNGALAMDFSITTNITFLLCLFPIYWYWYHIPKKWEEEGKAGLENVASPTLNVLPIWIDRINLYEMLLD